MSSGMAMSNFNTLQAAKELQDAGVETSQAEAMIGVMSRMVTEGLATKKDVQTLEAKVDAGFAAINTKLDAKTAALDAKIDTKVTALDTKLDAKTAALDVKIDNSVALLTAKMETQANRTIIWLGGTMVAAAISLGVLLTRIYLAAPAAVQ